MSASIVIQSNGTLSGTSVYVDVPDEGSRTGMARHEIYVTGFAFQLDADAPGQRAEVMVTLPDARFEGNFPIEHVAMVREPTYTIQDVTPWWARLWLALKARVS